MYVRSEREEEEEEEEEEEGARAFVKHKWGTGPSGGVPR